MAKRIEVTDPHTGVTVKVREGSRQAKLWGKPAKRAEEPTGDAEKRKPGRPKKSE